MGAKHFRSSRSFVFQDNDGQRTFAPFLIGNRDDGGLLNERMGHQGILKVDRTDPFTARLDQILSPIGDSHKAFAVDGADVASAEPALVCPIALRRAFQAFVLLSIALKVTRSDPR